MQSAMVQLKATPRGVAARPSVIACAVPKGAPNALLLAASALAVAAPAMAFDVSEVATDSAMAAGGIAAAAGLAGVLLATDPQKRRNDMAQTAGGDEMSSVKQYFDTTGFERWNRIYSDTDDVNSVQLDIRKGHAQTVDKVLKWLDEEGGVKDVTICDCGCGTGSLAIPLALRGATMNASDISSSMAKEAERRFNEVVAQGAPKPSTAPKFEALDLESVTGKYDVVTCLDVMIHYPQDKVDAMIAHLASLSDRKLIISFAPNTLSLLILKRIGELFPGPSKATRAYLHKEDDVVAALGRAGFKVVKREMTSTSFYFSRLLEAVKA